MVNEKRKLWQKWLNKIRERRNIKKRNEKQEIKSQKGKKDTQDRICKQRDTYIGGKQYRES